ncbi:uncharacterized protein LOC114329448 [Diabrotica virgifera virgifera]|uniref:Uncharacterized protein LOC114329448 n=1 Tax=Diabrotica virgifera virgifera TaxID=50390 RepID=A0A6P7FHF0_DIAVI|nr:uncharacterized protein LOC114329448 [Diabrotica virgifera virgifera]
MGSNKQNILKHSEVHKEIIAHPPKIRSDEDKMGPYNRYNDENREIYLEKKRMFEEACHKYAKMNADTVNTYKIRLHENYIEGLDLCFLDNRNSKHGAPITSSGLLLKKRTERRAHEIPAQDHQIPCNVEPWFRKYLILNKFIWAARITIIKNRLLRNLNLLSRLDRESVKQYEIVRKPYFGSYKDIFEKFTS